MSGALAVFSCGGASQGNLEGPPPPPKDGEVTAVLVEPTQEEREKGGVETVTISSSEGVATWIGSPIFFESGWSEGSEGNAARYRIVFEGASGELATYWIGTTKGSPVTYLCFGFCNSWWVSPSLENGDQDATRYRVIPDKDWQPLAREWYLAEQDESE